jgi:hypothetical protein
LSGILFFILFSIPKNTITYFLSGKQKLLISFYKGVSWNLTNFKVN